MRRRTWTGTLLGALACTIALTACSGDDPRPLTSAEAQRLALARSSMYDAGFVDLTMAIPVDGQTLHVDGRADMVEHEAYGLVETGDSPPRHALLQWTLADKAIVEHADDLPATPPTSGWQVAAMVPGDPLDNALQLTLNLASDRPENPVLIEQSGARWVGSDSVDGTDVDIFEVPASTDATTTLRYWVDDDGTLHRVDADTGRTDRLVVDLSPSADENPIPLIDELSSR